MSSEEWEDHMQSDETTSSAYSSSCGGNSDSGEEEEKTDYTTSTLHVINLLQPVTHHFFLFSLRCMILSTCSRSFYLKALFSVVS